MVSDMREPARRGRTLLWAATTRSTSMARPGTAPRQSQPIRNPSPVSQGGERCAWPTPAGHGLHDATDPSGDARHCDRPVCPPPATHTSEVTAAGLCGHALFAGTARHSATYSCSSLDGSKAGARLRSATKCDGHGSSHTQGRATSKEGGPADPSAANVKIDALPIRSITFAVATSPSSTRTPAHSVPTQRRYVPAGCSIS